MALKEFIDNFDKKQFSWQLTLILYSCLLIMLIVDHSVIRHAFYWPVWLMQTLPLLAVLPGLLQRRARSGIWLCFMILFHLISAISNIATSGNNIFYYFETALILVLFTSSMLFVRWQTQS